MPLRRRPLALQLNVFRRVSHVSIPYRSLSKLPDSHSKPVSTPILRSPSTPPRSRRATKAQKHERDPHLESSADSPSQEDGWASATASFLFYLSIMGFCGHQLLQLFHKTEGPSMLPTIDAHGVRTFTNPYYRRGRGIQVGDLVSADHPFEPGEGIIKRVLGMPGDIVCAAADPEEGGKLIRVPVGHCWVAGDNPNGSIDSRYYGPLPLALIIGKVEAVIWPPRSIEWFRDALTPFGETISD